LNKIRFSLLFSRSAARSRLYTQKSLLAHTHTHFLLEHEYKQQASEKKGERRCLQKRKIAHRHEFSTILVRQKVFFGSHYLVGGTTCTTTAGYALVVLQCRVRRVSICKQLWRCAGCGGGGGRCIVTARVADQSCARRMTSLSHVFKPFGNCFSGQLKTSLSFWLPHTHTGKEEDGAYVQEREA
jgi:hypothetical protein